MFKSAEIAELQGKITTLEAELKTATDGQARIEAELATAKTDLAAALTKQGTLETSLTEASGKITKLEAELVTANQKADDAEASVQTKVTEQLAAAGVDPVKRDPSAKTDEPGTKPSANGLKGIAKARAALATKTPAKAA
jgi:chromosome segregation ATPase